MKLWIARDRLYKKLHHEKVNMHNISGIISLYINPFIFTSGSSLTPGALPTSVLPVMFKGLLVGNIWMSLLDVGAEDLLHIQT
jgi:hypothetical protein